MTLLFQLLDGKPEQEQNLLRLLVNKLVCSIHYPFGDFT